MNNPKYDTIFLDADETLFDFLKSEEIALNNALKKNNLIYTEERKNLYSKINLSCWKLMEKGEITLKRLRLLRFELFFQEIGEKIDAESFNDDYMDFLSKAGILLPDALELVEKLHPFCKLYITTNGLAKVQKGRLAISPIKPLVDGMFISEEINFRKPQKEYFDHIFNTLGIKDKNRCIILGDSLTSDMQGGRNAGISTCLYTPNGKIESKLCDFQITNLLDFLNVVFIS